ncbi:MAG: hypothetical protein RO257_13290 [Candidatus Kapabacteria bacterium]|nr:hypothetical protein [Candidatus Kapabacteria bacterium]
MPNRNEKSVSIDSSPNITKIQFSKMCYDSSLSTIHLVRKIQQITYRKMSFSNFVIWIYPDFSSRTKLAKDWKVIFQLNLVLYAAI